MNRVAVIGGGWAGCAAAVELARHGHAIELHEASAALGGRARCVMRDGLPLDNGEHLLLGACTETLALAATLHDGDGHAAWTRQPFAIHTVNPAQANALSFAAPRLPANVGLLVGLLCARGLDWRERIAAIRWFDGQRRRGWRCEPHANAAELLSELPSRVRDNLLGPLCVAALNTPPARASGQMFLNVLSRTMGAGRDATAMIVPRRGLANAVPGQAENYLRARGHTIRLSTRVRVHSFDATGVTLETPTGFARADAVVVAVGPHQLPAAFAAPLAECDARITTALAQVARFTYEPIITVYLGYAAPFVLRRGLLRLDDAPGQWLFDREDILRRAQPCANRPPLGALLSVVISAGSAHDALPHRDRVAAIDAQLRRLAPPMSELCWSQVIEEKRATYACVPRLERPACGALTDRIYLAGDYTDDLLPATLEAAVRSGKAAARAIVGNLERRAAAAPAHPNK